VALAAYAASAISRGDPMKTSVIATRLAAAGYIIPFFFAFNPQMMFIDATPGAMVLLIILSFTGIICVSAGLSGYFFGRMRVHERIIAFPAGLLLIVQNPITVAIGVTMLATIIVMQKVRNNKNKALPA